MATIQQAIELVDGVSPALSKMDKAINKSVGAFEKAAISATKLEGAATASGAKISSAADSAGDHVNKLTVDVENLDRKLKNAGGGAFSKIKDALGSTLAQFTIGNLASNAIMAIGSAIASLPSKLAGLSDTYAQMQARLRLVAGGAKEAVELNEAIYRSALRARGSYDAMADSVTKVAMMAKDAFPDPKEVVPFMEGIQKLFVIGGTDAQQASAAMLQLTQALGSGRLQGDEFRSIAEAAPLIQEMIARTMGVSRGELKELSSQGVITAEIIKQAILENMGEINNMFAEMPMTFGQSMQMIETVAFHSFGKVFDKLSELANGDIMNRFTAGVLFAVQVAADMLYEFVNTAMWAAGQFFSFVDALSELGLVEPILAMVTAGMVTFVAIQSVGIVEAIAHAGALALQEAATIALTIAQEGLNVALMMNPIGAVILLVVALVGAFYAAVEAVNLFAGTSISATGLIFGAFNFLFTGVMNMVKWTVNNFIAFANFLGTLFVDPLGAIYNLFTDIWNGIVGLVGAAVNGILSMIAKIPGLEGVAGSVSIPTIERKAINGGIQFQQLEYGDMGKAFDAGYDTGANMKMPSLGDMLPKDEEYGNEIGKKLDDIEGNTADNAGSGKGTKENTGKIAEAMDIVDEDFKYLREFAEQEAINRYTTATVQIEMGGVNNNISSDTDVDGIMSAMVEKLEESMQAGAEKARYA